MSKIGPDFYVDNTQGKIFDCRLETSIGRCDCEKIEQCKYSIAPAEIMDVFDGPEQECYVTNPLHGGKATCHTCQEFIVNEKFVMNYGVYFHKDCWNGYEHYYGLDKPID